MEQLGATGVQFFSNISGRPLDCPDLLELLELCAERRYPIWLHPTRGIETPDYASEQLSQLELWWLIGWPLETALAMVRLAYTGFFDRWPEQVIIAHHAGGVLPMVAGRIENGGAPGGRTPAALRSTCNPASREPLAQALRHFHVDSATFGSRAAIACGLDFFGSSHMLFATDMPFGPQQGLQIIAKTLNAISQLRLTGSERQAILAGNATRLLSRSSSALTSS
jgi:aminocarboxymuconate-semialdehyde decarboxylase